MTSTELQRVETEIEWFEALLDAIRDGKTPEATNSILDAMRNLREYRQFLVDDGSVPAGASPSLPAASPPLKTDDNEENGTDDFIHSIRFALARSDRQLPRWMRNSKPFFEVLNRL